MTFGLTSAGLSLPRMADFRTQIRADLNVLLSAAGYPTIADDEWGDDLLLSAIVDVQAQKLDEVLQYLPEIYSQRVRANAEGVVLDDLGTIVGVPRNQATYSTATVTLTGTAGTVILAGAVVEGGGTDGRARWTLGSDATIAGGGTVDATVTCTTAGAISADPGDIDKIVTPQAGWTAVTNAAAASQGNAIETDAAYRLRQQASLASAEGPSAASLRAQLLDLDFITGAYIIENDDTASTTVGALTVPGCSVAPILWPNSLTTAQEASVAAVLYRYVGGAQVYGTGVSKTVSSDGVTSKTVAWTYASEVAITTVATLTLETGYSLSDVQTAVETAIEAYINALSVGENVRLLDVYDAIAGVEGVAEAAVTLNGSAAGVSIGSTQIASVSSTTVTT